MGMFKDNPPALPLAEQTYNPGYFNRLTSALRLYFNNLNAVQHLNVASLNIDTSTLPTEAVLADLRVGDVYVDTTAGDVLKVKL